MNDFTKQELKEIHNSLDNDPSMCRVSDNVLRKIQSMIDNYCEHEWEHQCEACAVQECKKCGIVRWQPHNE